MNHPYESNINANLKYNQMLNDADAHRRAQQVIGERPSFIKALFSRVGRSSKVAQAPKGAVKTKPAG